MTEAQPIVKFDAAQQCELCAKPRGEYRLSRICCCVRLLRTAQPGGPRRAMYAHLLACCTDEQIAAVREAAEREGLTRAETA